MTRLTALLLSLFASTALAAPVADVTTTNNNTTLSLIPVTAYKNVVRLGVTAAGDSPPTHYIPSNSACSLNAGAGDNGYQVRSADNKCWIAEFGTTASPSQWGAVPNTPAADNHSFLETALANSPVPILIKADETYYTSQFTIPDKSRLVCADGGTISRANSFTAIDGRPLVKISSTTGTSIQGCTFSGNTPAYGNWISGIAPNGSTANTIIRDITVNDFSFKGIDWDDSSWTDRHVNEYWDNIRVNNTGWSGAIFQGLDHTYVGRLSVISTGAEAIQFLWNWGSTLDSPYANKSTPPTLLFGGQLGTTSGSSITIPGSPAGNISLVLGAGLAFTTQNYIKVFQTSTPTNYVAGNIVSYDPGSGATILHVTAKGGSGTSNAWTVTGETGMLLFQSLNFDSAVISPVLINNTNAVSDGFGAGENGAQSTTSHTVPTSFPTVQTYTITGVSTNFPWIAGFPITIVPPGHFEVEMHGHVVSYSNPSLTVSIDNAKGSGTYTNWQLNSEDGNLVVTNLTVDKAGLFGLDCMSNLHVTGGVVSQASARGIGAGYDLGGRMSNCQVSGLTIKNTGLASGFGTTSATSNTIASTGSLTFSVPHAVTLVYQTNFRLRAYDQNTSYDNTDDTTGNWVSGLITAVDTVGNTITILADASNGSGTFSAWNLYIQNGTGIQVNNGGTAPGGYPVTAVLYDIFFQSVPIVDERLPSGTQIGINVPLTRVFLQNIIYDLPPVVAPAGYAASYNVFGTPTYSGDPHMNGAAFPFFFNESSMYCEGTLNHPVSATGYMEYTGGSAAIFLATNFSFVDKGTCNTTVTFPLPPGIITSQSVNQQLPGYDRSTGAVALVQCLTNSPLCNFGPAVPFVNGDAYQASGSIIISPPW